MALAATRAGGLANKVALITGATSGIGRATALAFAEAGAAVVIGDILERPIGDGPPTTELIREVGGRARFVKTDVAEKSEVERLVRVAVQEFGGIDILVNNAGIGHVSLVQHTPDRVVRRVVEVNFLAVVYGTQAVLPVMRAQGQGHIINIASGAAMMGLPYASIYAASKAAMMRFSDALRYELEGSNIAVSVVYPDFTGTDLALEVTPGGGAETKTVRSLNASGLARYGQPAFKLQSSARVAQAVLGCALRPRKEVYLSSRIRFHGLLRSLFPAAVAQEVRGLKDAVEQFLTKVSGEDLGAPEKPTN